MEYCGGGSVNDLMAVCNRPLTEEQIALIVRDTLEALQHLHSKSMIHRDIKAGSAYLNAQRLGCVDLVVRHSPHEQGRVEARRLWSIRTVVWHVS